jgi:hypothetical protein
MDQHQHDSHRNPGRANAEARARAEAMVWGRSEVNHGDSPYKALADLCAEERLEQARDAITDLMHYVDHLLLTEADLMDGTDLVDVLEQAQARYDEEFAAEVAATKERQDCPSCRAGAAQAAAAPERAAADPHPDLVFYAQVKVHGQVQTMMCTAAGLTDNVPGWRAMLPAEDEYHVPGEVDRERLLALASEVAMTQVEDVLSIE